MTKSEAINRIRQTIDVDLNNSNTSFSNPGKSLALWWLEPRNDKFKTGFYIILNNTNRKKLLLFKIPKGAVNKFEFRQREDREASTIYIPISDTKYIDTGRFDFSPYLIHEIDYQEVYETNSKQELTLQTKTEAKELKGQITVAEKVVPKRITLHDHQTGISYNSLFADYVKNATKIILTDPYLRSPYQFKNLMEFCVMLAQNKAVEGDIHLHIITWNSKEDLPESELSFKELISGSSEMVIKLTYEYKHLHDRHIDINNGWRIQLGRGLDIFERREGRFNPAQYYQEMRRCKNCEIIYLKNNF